MPFCWAGQLISEDIVKMFWACMLKQNLDFLISEDCIEGSMSLGNTDRNFPLAILSLISKFLIEIKLKIDMYKNINCGMWSFLKRTDKLNILLRPRFHFWRDICHSIPLSEGFWLVCPQPMLILLQIMLDGLVHPGIYSGGSPHGLEPNQNVHCHQPGTVEDVSASSSWAQEPEVTLSVLMKVEDCLECRDFCVPPEIYRKLLMA